jgi:DNA-binding TFAR19-related protein (PDSD5 family)
MPDDELTSLREKRKRELMAQRLKKELAQKKQEEAILKEKDRLAKATMIVNKFLEPDAVIYMDWLTKTKPVVAQTIKDTIIMLVYQKQLLRPLSKIDLMKIERELTGQESSIKVKKRGEDITDLSSKMKKDHELDK